MQNLNNKQVNDVSGGQCICYGTFYTVERSTVGSAVSCYKDCCRTKNAERYKIDDGMITSCNLLGLALMAISISI